MNNNYSQMQYPYQEGVDSYQQRLTTMAQQVTGQTQPYGFNPNYPRTQSMAGNNMMQQFPNQSFIVRTVTGYEEAMASQTPFDGSISIMIDPAHDMVYTKQLNMSDGNPLFKQYKKVDAPLKQEAPTVEKSVEYVERSEFEELKTRFNELWGALTDQPKQQNSAKTKKEEGK